MQLRQTNRSGAVVQWLHRIRDHAQRVDDRHHRRALLGKDLSQRGLCMPW